MTTWVSGQPWRVVNCLNKLNTQIRAYAPRAVPPATDPNSWGALADDRHNTSSQHYPHYINGLGPTAVVTARDFPHAPKLGLNCHVVSEHLRLQRDPRLWYIIFDGYITGTTYNWEWHPFSGDPHRDHMHVSSVQTALADSNAAWSLPGLIPDLPAPYMEEPMLFDIPKLGSHLPITIPSALRNSALLELCNDTFGEEYALRMLWTTGNGGWSNFPGCGQTLHLPNGVAWQIALPDTARGVTISRWGYDPRTNALIDPSTIPLPSPLIYDGPLTVAIA